MTWETGGLRTLIGAQIRCHGHDVGPVGHGGVHAFRETSLAAVPACALDLHLKMGQDHGINLRRSISVVVYRVNNNLVPSVFVYRSSERHAIIV